MLPQPEIEDTDVFFTLSLVPEAPQGCSIAAPAPSVEQLQSGSMGGTR